MGIAYWGGTYLYACVLALTSSDSPVVLNLKTPGGIVKLRARSLQYDFNKNVLHATEAVIYEPDGRRLLSVRELTILDLVPGKKTIRGYARGVTGRIERNPDRKWKFLDYLPKAKGEPSEIAFSFDLKDVSVRVEDQAVKHPFSRWVASSNLHVDGVGDDIVASGPVRIEGTGTTNFTLRRGKNSLYVAGNGRMELSPFIGWVKETPEAKDIVWLPRFDVKKLTSEGPWEITYEKEKFGLRVPAKATFEQASFDRYRADHGEIQGSLTESGFDGTAHLVSGPSTADFSGRIRWQDKIEVAGLISGKTPSAATLPPDVRQMLPKGVAFRNGAFSGWLSYRDDISIQGLAQVGEVTYLKETFKAVEAKLDVNPISVSIALNRGMYMNQPVMGAMQVGRKDNRLEGYVRSDRVLLEPILKKFGFEGLRGQGAVTAMLSGTTKSPLVQFTANGQAKSTLSGSLLDLGDFSVRGKYAGDRVTLERSGIKGPSGSAYASGAIDLKSGTLNLDVLASDFPVEALTQDAQGAASFRGIVRGKMKSPIAEGQAEIYNLKVAGQEVPVAFANLTADKNGLEAKNLIALRGGSRVQGNAGIQWKDKTLHGLIAAYGIQASDWLPDQVAGLVNVTNGKLGGTLTSPTLTADVNGNNLVVPGLKLDSVAASIGFKEGILHIGSGIAKVGSGTIEATGDVTLESKSGTFAVNVKELPLARLLLDTAESLNMSGTFSTEGTVALKEGELSAVKSAGNVSDLALNETVLGSGDVKADFANGLWTGSALVGQIDSFIEISRLTANPANQELDAEFTMSNIALPKLVGLAERYGKDGIPESVQQFLNRLDGNLDFSGTTSGKWTNPILESKTFSLEALKIDGVDAGMITSNFSRNEGLWNIADFKWQGPVTQVDAATGQPLAANAPANTLKADVRSVFAAAGTVDEHGNTHVKGSLNNLRASWLAAFVPGMSSLAGSFDISNFLVDGPTKSPVVQASVGYAEAAEPGKESARSIDIDTTIKDGAIDANGVYQLNGFTGPIEAHAPFRYPFAFAEDGDLFAKITLPERKLTDLTALWPTLDLARTHGAVKGEVTVTGRPGALKFEGSASLFPGTEAKGVQVADTKVATYLKDLDASVIFNGERIGLNAKGNSSESGSFKITDVGMGLNDVFSAILDGNTDTFFRNAVAGTVDFDRFKATYSDKTAGKMTASLSGTVALKGTVGEPAISGDLVVNEGNLAVPTFEATGESKPLMINPKFDLGLTTAQPITFRAGAGQFDLTGAGSLKGSLVNPDMEMLLTTRKGSIRLPNARIAIEEGGTIQITYRTSSAGTVASRADLNLEGRTQLTAERFSGGVERYDIFLTITGDLLQDGGLVLNARSDPPDLSSDRIMTLLGQGDFIRTLGVGSSLNAQEQIRSALVSIALPYLAGSLTDKLASSLGLDYINVEYSSYDRVSITAAISLGRDFVLSGRRQISTPLPGERQKYDIRLSYRPRFGGPVLNRFSFSLGLDQDRPWKISVEYGIKF